MINLFKYDIQYALRPLTRAEEQSVVHKTGVQYRAQSPGIEPTT